MCNDKLVGLASFGLQCGASLDYPGVYVDIFYYRDWILENWSGASALKSFNILSLFMPALFINLILTRKN